MTTPINLNKARKANARSNKQARATENRVKYGRTKAQKASEKSEADRLRKVTDAAKTER